MRTFGTTDWFLDLPHEISGAITKSYQDSKLGRILGEFLWAIAFILIMSVAGKLLINTTANNDSDIPVELGLTGATIIISVLILFAVLAHLLVGMVCIFAPAPLKGAIYSNFTKLTETDLHITSRRRNFLDGKCETEQANTFINRDCSKRALRTLGMVLVITLAIALLTMTYESS